MSPSRFVQINLVGYRVDQQKIVDQKKNDLTRVSIIALVVFLVIFVPVLIVRFSFSAKKGQVEADVEQLTNDIEALKESEQKYALLDKKSSAIIAMQAERIVIQPKILEVYDVMPEGTVIDDVSFGEGGEFLNVSVAADTVFSMATLLQSFTDAVGTKFEKVRVDSTKRAEDGTYKVTMEIYFAAQEHSETAG